MQKLSFYKDRVCLNCLTNSLQNACDIAETTDGYVAVGLLSANYPDADTAIADMKKYQQAVNNHISVGLGAGNPKQWKIVATISAALRPGHINQVFTAGGYTRARTGDGPFLNAMIAPSGIPGQVKISTGPLSQEEEPAVIPVATAIAMAREQGADSFKFFPMGGLQTRDEYQAVAEACAANDFGLEPTGGIDLHNFKEILQIAVDAGVPRIIPHVYSSIIDKDTGATRVADVKTLYQIIRAVV